MFSGRRALLQCADSGPRESLVAMLESVGIQCSVTSKRLNAHLRNIGFDTVIDSEDLVQFMGYDVPHPLPVAEKEHLSRFDLFVDLKAHRNGPLLWKHYPSLKEKTLWYRINGGEPAHLVRGNQDFGNELDPPCPVLTPNRWYHFGMEGEPFVYRPWGERAYSCWPPFVRFHEYLDQHPRATENWEPPVCLIHGVSGWGYGPLCTPLREQVGLKIYGRGSPDGLRPHAEIPGILSRTLAMIHLKSNDAPGYALYEAMAAGCPIICTRRLIWRCKMQELLIPGETCLVFDRETHDPLNDPKELQQCVTEVQQHLKELQNPETNQRIGMAGRTRLQQVLWSPQKEEDRQCLNQFFAQNFWRK